MLSDIISKLGLVTDCMALNGEGCKARLRPCLSSITVWTICYNPPGWCDLSNKLMNHNQSGDLLRMTSEDRDAGAAVLGRAFGDYDVFRYYFHDEAGRREAAHTFALISLSVCLKYGEVYASSARFEGVAGWLPPGQAHYGLWQIIGSVPLSLLARSRRQVAGVMWRYGRFVDRLHRRLVPYPHWCLEIIGVDPVYQGQGFSSRLLRPVLERIDRDQMPCYVETNTQKNVAIYRRFGFEVLCEDRLPGTEVTIFAMLRKVQTA